MTQPKTVLVHVPDPIKVQVNCSWQDQSGNIWFGTYGAGVYRFDGKSFIHFTTKDGLSNDYIWCFYEDKAGTLWVGTADGISQYNDRKFKSISIGIIEGDNAASVTFHPPTTVDAYGVPSLGNSVFSILQDRNGKFWLATNDGIYRYDGTTYSRFLKSDGVKDSSGQSIGMVESILEDRKGNIWFGGRGSEGLFCFDGKTLRGYKLDVWVRPVFEDKAGNIWFCSTHHNVFRYDGKSFSYDSEKEFKDWVFSIAEDHEGNLWFSNARNGGVIRYNGKAIRNISTKDGLCDNAVWNILTDRDGNTWFGTRRVGLCRYDGNSFTHFAE